MTKAQKIAIFDIDGTIFRKNLHFELIDELVWMKVFPVSARKNLTSLYSKWLEHTGTYDSYRDAIIALYARHIAGCKISDVISASQAVVSFHKKRTYVFAENLISKLKRENYHIIAISGSPIEAVEEFNNAHLKFDKVFGSVYETNEEGIYNGKEIFAPPKNKGDIIKKYVYENRLSFHDSYGVGDTESDAGFMALTENPIAFNPNHNLREIAKKNNWSVVVEKKDVIYHIK